MVSQNSGPPPELLVYKYVFRNSETWFYIKSGYDMMGIDATPGNIKVIVGQIPDYVFELGEQSCLFTLLVVTGITEDMVNEALTKPSGTHLNLKRGKLYPYWDWPPEDK